MDSFCIISTPREETHTVTPDGYEYVSEADSRIHVDFPLGAVSQDETVDFRVGIFEIKNKKYNLITFYSNIAKHYKRKLH